MTPMNWKFTGDSADSVDTGCENSCSSIADHVSPQTVSDEVKSFQCISSCQQNVQQIRQDSTDEWNVGFGNVRIVQAGCQVPPVDADEVAVVTSLEVTCNETYSNSTNSEPINSYNLFL